MKEVKVPRTMRVVRAWLPSKAFQYFTIYSDGSVELASRKEADQYVKAYGINVETIYGKPETKIWKTSITGK